MKTQITFLFLLVSTFIFCSPILRAQEKNMAEVKGGNYIPLYGVDSESVRVQPFLMDVHPVTNEEFLKFVKENPEWQKTKIKRIFADENYLSMWENDFSIGELNPNAPVTNISWFAAKKYCECQDKRLPTMDEWEFVAMANETQQDARKIESYNKYILKWYETPRTYNNNIGETYKNYWGIYDLQGLVWEWVSDFNTVFIGGESRKDTDFDTQMFCGSAAIGANDLKDYASFMRYAFRGSLQARYTVRNLGFRCVKDIEDKI